ncbi:hypothetical protein EDD11_007421 [Mortierella claussenii]|nr:hypothetical protein EDD11_007421 [Mortierella claussenii]
MSTDAEPWANTPSADPLQTASSSTLAADTDDPTHHPASGSDTFTAPSATATTITTRGARTRGGGSGTAPQTAARSGDTDSKAGHGGIGAGSSAGATAGGAGSRGPIGPRPGVFRPCARCRVKKTKCDRLKPSCSTCQKSGDSVACVYDNDEPTLGVVARLQDMDEKKTLKGSTDQESVSVLAGARQSRSASKTDSLSSSPGASKGSSAGAQNQDVGRNGGNANGSNNDKTSPADKRTTTSLNSKTPITVLQDPQVQQTIKKMKTGTATSAAVRPSPLRTSMTTAKSPLPSSSFASASSSQVQHPPSPSSVPAKRRASPSNGLLALTPEIRQGATKNDLEEEEQDNAGLNENDRDDVVSELSVKDAHEQQDVISLSVDATKPDRNAPARSKKQSAWVNSAGSSVSGAAGTNNRASSGQSKIMVELASRPPPPLFIIDRNQKARKWGKSFNAFQTLGGEVTIPLWTSDQEMLLNEPRPLFVQQTIPALMTTGRKDSSLARLAVLSQLDVDMDLDSPERGNTPDSMEGSPGPTGPQQAVKKKRNLKRQQQQSMTEEALNHINSNVSFKGFKGPAQYRKRVHVVDSSATSVVGDDEDEGNSPSTPTPVKTSGRSTPVPTRPRKYPCSFEGCPKSFMDKFHLDRHEARHVTEEIVCGIDGCTKAYNSISTVRRHQSIVHKDKKLQMEQEKQLLLEEERQQERAIENEKEKEKIRQQEKGKEEKKAAMKENAIATAALEPDGDVHRNTSTKDKISDKISKNVISGKKRSKKIKAPAAAAAAEDAEVERVKMALALKEMKDAAYRPWMDHAEVPVRTSAATLSSSKDGQKIKHQLQRPRQYQPQRI